MPTRRDFVRSATLMLTAGLAATGCAYLDKYAIRYEIWADISEPHGHSGGITEEQMTSPEPLEIDITGFANHPHTVKLSAGELRRIIAGEMVTIESSVHGAHTHMVRFRV